MLVLASVGTEGTSCPSPKGARNGRQRRQEGQGKKQKAEREETKRQIKKTTGEAEAEDALANVRANGFNWESKGSRHRLADPARWQLPLSL